MHKKLLILLPLLALFATHFAEAQSAYDNTAGIYYRKIGGQAALYNGELYNRPTNITSGHAYLDADSLMRGSVFYDGLLFTGVLLALDQTTDELITETYNRANLLQLVKSKVQYFEINNKLFIRKSFEGVESFFQRLYEGRSGLLNRETKKIEKNIVSQLETEFNIALRTRYYLNMKGRLVEVRSRREFLKLLGEQRAAVNRFLNQKRLNFRKDTEQYLISGITHYDELSK